MSHTHLQRLRGLIRADLATCAICHSDEKLRVRELPNGWVNETGDDLVIFCNRCHELFFVELHPTVYRKPANPGARSLKDLRDWEAFCILHRPLREGKPVT